MPPDPRAIHISTDGSGYKNPGGRSGCAAIVHYPDHLDREDGLAWPWESLHIEALAWFDHWLKAQDTGILDPRFRYMVPEAEGWRTSDAWPIREASHHAYALRADGVLSEEEGEAGIPNLHEPWRWSQSPARERDGPNGVPALDDDAPTL